ncbi:hypothetical protein EDC14_104437 [Hydrogenispora ethanolica]|jgi:hypothetical protein|uniref:Uncharacterized protein n=1 Tax=Hydrogenispora ethanolica TaxID=1082276 RepID=A0A4R1QVB4_HYDET|nr:hypothetical protein [Hydrogenispora ethanolica]TCL57888.1 hypothetical protein EDC14_104437 [Hydrogenispora ethanolica]
MIGKEIFFFYKALIFSAAALLLIPKPSYKKYFMYGLLFGGIGDILVIMIFGKLLHLFEYQNLGIFNIADSFSFWTPWAWIATFAYFLYLLPVRKLFLALYILEFAFFGHTVGITLSNLGLFEYHGGYRYWAPAVYALWFSLAAWLYIRLEKLKLE